jgi:predicted ribonuclease toxin of YeeF-YezG toxin-antitoxin module
MTIEDIYDMIRDNEKKLDKILELLEEVDDER